MQTRLDGEDSLDPLDINFNDACNKSTCTKALLVQYLYRHSDSSHRDRWLIKTTEQEVFNRRYTKPQLVSMAFKIGDGQAEGIEKYFQLLAGARTKEAGPKRVDLVPNIIFYYN